MEFRKVELTEEVYSPAPLQQSAFARALPSPPSSSSALFFARGGEAMGSSSLAQKPSYISVAPPAADGMRPETEPRYRECLRNHAASVGGHVLDGCCEFMPSAGEALRCAACGCHRSFHRKSDGEMCELRNGAATPLLLPPPAAHGHPKAFGAASGLMVLAGNSCAGAAAAAAGTESSSEDLAAQRPFVVSRKRFRTKFTTEQKEKMLAFAEKVGWRMQGGDEGAVDHFCGEVGVRRHVFKVWMHNNKSSLKKQNHQQQQPQQQQQLLEDDEEEEEHQNQPIHHHRHQ
ncbi:zinc-finger homeodomain protein 6-like [Zingiber officinale]|uniref:zinc-finger homeodomain protein 6-like n=1 Tax=Zingiber officinale TaxID=94328 RepID=UPI001C4BDF97|nr:zinc-finger homeodomain protein 6-like [Zingiber officinale]